MSKSFESAKGQYLNFIQQCEISSAEYGLTPISEATPFGLCFAIFGYHLVGEKTILSSRRQLFDGAIRSNLDAYRLIRQQKNDLQYDKPYLQLLTFSLSALHILGTLRDAPLEEKVREATPPDIKSYLDKNASLKGLPRSGNMAMFAAILLLHQQNYLDLDKSAEIETWVDLHLSACNAQGFWGASSNMSHLQFQNGYHQYEVLEYLGVKEAPWEVAAYNVAQLADQEGHFAPYIGGGGCYDYDAIFMLTATKQIAERHRKLLGLTYQSILGEQNSDGGFCESQRVRPISIENIGYWLKHIKNSSGSYRKERIRQFFTLLRPKHNRVATHWSIYSRKWNESDLWDSWFRMLAIARIESALGIGKSMDWRFISYPGIGFNAHSNYNC